MNTLFLIHQSIPTTKIARANCPYIIRTSFIFVIYLDNSTPDIALWWCASSDSQPFISKVTFSYTGESTWSVFLFHAVKVLDFLHTCENAQVLKNLFTICVLTASLKLLEQVYNMLLTTCNKLDVTVMIMIVVIIKKYKTFSALIYRYINTSGNWKNEKLCGVFSHNFEFFQFSRVLI